MKSTQSQCERADCFSPHDRERARARARFRRGLVSMFAWRALVLHMQARTKHDDATIE